MSNEKYAWIMNIEPLDISKLASPVSAYLAEYLSGKEYFSTFQLNQEFCK